MPSLRRTCLLFTKNFPYGIHENYLFNELPSLREGFDRVVFIPVDEYDYEPAKNRLQPTEGFEILEINRPDFNPPALNRARREQAVMASFVKEWLKSRERTNLIRHRGKLLSIMRHLHRSSVALNRWIRQEALTPSDTVCYHYWFHNGLMLTWMMETYAAGIRLPQIARAHSGDLYHRDWNRIQQAREAFIPFEQIKWRQADRVFVISDHGQRFVERTFPRFLHKTQVARLGVTDHGWTPREPVQGMRTIITCSLISANKRLHLLTDILVHVTEPVRWIHFGGGSEAAKAEIRVQMAARCPNSEVEFAGIVPNHEIIAFYQSHPVDLIVNLSLAEGIPVALMEAASFGVPMLATETVGNPEIVNNTNGILIPVQFEPVQVAEKINHLFADPAHWKACSAESRRTFESHYHAGRNYRAFTTMLLDSLQR